VFKFRSLPSEKFVLLEEQRQFTIKGGEEWIDALTLKK
jgi:hypothetical protein